MSPKVAVIGGGPLGLMALKNFKEDGFETTLYESRAWVGGLWKYSKDASLSTAENTIFNSSKFRTAITDFPVPEDMDDFPTAPQLHKYLESYCDHFELWPHIKLNSRVEAVKRTDQRWAVEVAAHGDSTSSTEYFDKVAISCGPFVQPKQPDIPGLNQFEGMALHAINFHEASQYKGQNVLVIGIHASSQDIVSSLAKHAKKVYISHRSGLRMIPRYTDDGSVYDRQPPFGVQLIMFYFSALFPTVFNWLLDKMIDSISSKAFPNVPASWDFNPAPSVAVTPPLIATELWPHLQSGFAVPVPDVLRISGPKKIELQSGRVLEDIDTIIYCTGYHSYIPVKIEPPELHPYLYAGSPPKLYRNIFPLNADPAIRNSLAFLGQSAIAFAGFAPHELQSMSISQIWQGRSSLPPLPEMERWHRDYLAWRENMKKQYNARDTFYTLMVPTADHVDWMDSCAGVGIRHHFGLVSRWTNWQAWNLWWSDRQLYNLCLTGVISPAIFRLFDLGKRKAWAGAREQIFIDNERVKQQQEVKKRSMEKLD